jgi:hypothetical protein
VIATGVLIPPASPPGQTYCELRAGADFDHRTLQGFNPNQWTPLSFQVAHTFSTPGIAALVCSGNGTTGSAAGFIADTKLSAVQVSRLSSTPQQRPNRGPFTGLRLRSA